MEACRISDLAGVQAVRTPENEDQLLLHAVKHGQLECVQWLWMHHRDLAKVEPIAVWQACHHGHLEMVQWLCDCGGELNRPSEYMMKLACKSGHVELVKWLYSQGVVTTIHNGRQLRRAAGYGHLNLVQWMLTVPPVGVYLDAAMYAAAELEQMRVVEWLLDRPVSDAAIVSLIEDPNTPMLVYDLLQLHVKCRQAKSARAI